jgi:hypothetical protein
MDEILSKSLEQLDGKPWGDASADATGLIERVHRLRTVALRDLTDEDLATLLGQREGAEWIIPLLFDRLETDPLAGEWYPGQLLANLLLNRDYFERFPNDLLKLHRVRTELIGLRDAADKLLTDPGWPRDI